MKVVLWNLYTATFTDMLHASASPACGRGDGHNHASYSGSSIASLK